MELNLTIGQLRLGLDDGFTSRRCKHGWGLDEPQRPSSGASRKKRNLVPPRSLARWLRCRGKTRDVTRTSFQSRLCRNWRRTRLSWQRRMGRLRSHIVGRPYALVLRHGPRISRCRTGPGCRLVVLSINDSVWRSLGLCDCARAIRRLCALIPF